MLAHMLTFYTHELTADFSRLTCLMLRGLSADRFLALHTCISAALVACSLAHARDLETAFFHTLTDSRWRGLSVGMHFFPEAPKLRHIRIHCKTQGMFNMSIAYSQGRQDGRLPCLSVSLSLSLSLPIPRCLSESSPQVHQYPPPPPKKTKTCCQELVSFYMQLAMAQLRAAIYSSASYVIGAWYARHVKMSRSTQKRVFAALAPTPSGDLFTRNKACVVPLTLKAPFEYVIQKLLPALLV